MEQKYEYAYAVAEGNTHAQVDWVAMRKKYNEDIGQKLRTVFGARAVRIGQDSHNNIYLHGLLFGPEKKGGHDISAWNKIRDYKNEDGERMLLAVPGANTKDWHYITTNIKNMVEPMRVYHLEELFTWTNTYILPRMDIPPQGECCAAFVRAQTRNCPPELHGLMPDHTTTPQKTWTDRSVEDRLDYQKMYNHQLGKMQYIIRIPVLKEDGVTPACTLPDITPISFDKALRLDQDTVGLHSGYVRDAVQKKLQQRVSLRR